MADTYIGGDDHLADPDDDVFYGDDPWARRRRQATIAMVVGAVLFLFSLVVLAGFLGASDGLLNALDFWSFGVWIGVFTLLLLALLTWLMVLLFTTPGAGLDEPWYDDEADALDGADGLDEDEEVVGLPETMALRCPRCTNVFNIQDSGERPLKHSCPHCGARGSFHG